MVCMMNDIDNIPGELKALPQWVCCWNGSKIPMRAFERLGASSTRPETWSPFTAAVEALEAKVYDWLGFVFADNGIVGIDIDCGFGPDGTYTDICREIIDWCGSYTELSRSGRGVHILVKGKLPWPGKNNLAGVEIYQSRRFFIMTGKVVDQKHKQLVEAQEAIDKILEKYFPERLREGKSSMVEKIYRPVWHKPEGGKIRIKPDYPEVESGNRNLSMTSLAGALHTTGYNKKQLYKQLCEANQKACRPPLKNRELINICESVTKYERKKR